jgi:acetyl esterase/lipase
VPARRRFIGGSLYTHRKLFGHLAKRTGARALIATYRHTPGHAYQAQLDDATTAYDWLLGQGTGAGHIAVAGDSSGAGLAVSTMPWVDMTVSNDSYDTNKERDAYFYRHEVQYLAGIFLAGTDPKDPLASPVLPT